MCYSAEQIASAIAVHLPGRPVVAVEYRGLWIRHIYKVTLADGERVVLKVQAGPEGCDPAAKEAWAAGLLRANGLPAPRTLAVDGSCTVLDQPFILQEAVGGRTLQALLAEAGEEQAADLYRAVGRFYRGAHGIHHHRSGWVVGAGEVMPFSPNRFMHQQVLVEYGEAAVRAGLMPPAVHRDMVALSTRSLPYLEEHTPTFLPGSALPWAIYLAHEGGEWRVTKVMDLHDSLFWDPAFDLAMLKYPPFGRHRAAAWQAFLSEYGAEPEEQRLRLYLLIQRVDAALGNYMEPETEETRAWRASCLAEVPDLCQKVMG